MYCFDYLLIRMLLPSFALQFIKSLLLHFHQIIYMQILQVEKKEVIKMKSDIEELQSSVISDLTQIREIMTTLLELEREKAQR